MQSVSTESKDDPTTPRYVMSVFYIKADGFLGVAAIDARRRTCPRWHDMAAGASLKREKMPITLRVCGKVVILQSKNQSYVFPSSRVIAGYDWFFVLCLYLIHAVLYMFPVAFDSNGQFYHKVQIRHLGVDKFMV